MNNPVGFIDAHHHVWAAGEPGTEWLRAREFEAISRTFTLAELEAQAATVDVVATVLVATGMHPAETRRLLSRARHSQMVAAVVGWVDLTRSDVTDELEVLRSSPGGELLVGVRHQVEREADPDWLCRPDVIAGLRSLAASHSSYDLLIRPSQLESALRAVRRVPELTFVVDHLGKPPIRSGSLEPWATWLSALAAEPNVFAKMSGLVTEADWSTWKVGDLRPYVEVALDAFGPSRIMVGSDWPVCLLAASYAAVFEATNELLASLTLSERSMVGRTTAEVAYRLPASRMGAST